MTNDTTISMEQFITDHNIRMTAVHTDTYSLNAARPDDKWLITADHWRCTFVRRIDGKRQQMTVLFHMGSGHKGIAPSAADVLDSLCSDAAGVDDVGDFEEWAGNYGYDSDSRTAERIYRACERQSFKLLHFLGQDNYEAALYSTERC